LTGSTVKGLKVAAAAVPLKMVAAAIDEAIMVFEKAFIG
jgi:hypothetical protein